MTQSGGSASSQTRLTPKPGSARMWPAPIYAHPPNLPFNNIHTGCLRLNTEPQDLANPTHEGASLSSSMEPRVKHSPAQ